MKRFFFLCYLMLSACAPDAERTQKDLPVGAKVTAVKDLMAAFNAHDADQMRQYWHDDVTWIEISGTDASIVTNNAEALHRELIVYFEAYPDVSSTLENVAVNGNYLSAIERPKWKQDGEIKSQASIVVYEFADNKIKRFWYYPPQSGEARQ